METGNFYHGAARCSGRKFGLSFLLHFLSIFVHISGSIPPITLIWASLERSFPPAEVEHRWCQFWSKVMTSEVEERPRLVTAGYGRHGSQWVKHSRNTFTLLSAKQTFPVIRLIDCIFDLLPTPPPAPPWLLVRLCFTIFIFEGQRSHPYKWIYMKDYIFICILHYLRVYYEISIWPVETAPVSQRSWPSSNPVQTRFFFQAFISQLLKLC